MSPAALSDLFRPEAGLNFPDVRFSKKKHAQPGLSDSSADAQRELPLEQFFMEEQLLSVDRSRHFQLPFQSGLVDADSHRGKFDGLFELRIPDNDISIKTRSPLGEGRPIVVVGRSPVVRLAVF